jgi:hypothetical protein
MRSSSWISRLTEPRSRPGPLQARPVSRRLSPSPIPAPRPRLPEPGHGVSLFRAPPSGRPHLSLCCSGAAGIRTPDLRRAKAALSQLSYDPPSVPARLVGAPGLEPGTSVLSGPRSNHLSYAPRIAAGWDPAPKTE